MRTHVFIVISTILFCKICWSKPVFGPIGVAEKQKIAEIIAKEQKSIALLKEEEALLERVVETLSREIEDKENRMEQLKSLGEGQQDAMANILDNYRRNFGANAAQYRPG